MPQKAVQESRDTMPVSIGIDRKDRQKLAELLNQALADTYVLYTKIQGVHWNVRGPLFYSVHKMTQAQYEDLAESIDEIAERVRALGFFAPVSLQEMLRAAKVKEESEHRDAATMLSTLVEDHQTVARSLRDAVEEATRVNDVFSADMLTARIGKHEEFAWMLRALADRD